MIDNYKPLNTTTMTTTTNNSNSMINEMIAYCEKVLNVCNNEIEYLTHPEKYGFGIYKCNSIVINKERLMTVTVDENNRTKHEFAPLYPTYFSPSAARQIVEGDLFSDCNGNRIKLEIVGKLEYYQLLKADTEKKYNSIKTLVA